MAENAIFIEQMTNPSLNKRKANFPRSHSKSAKLKGLHCVFSDANSWILGGGNKG